MSAQPAAAPVVSRTEFIALIAGLMALNALAIDIMLPALPYMGEALGVTNENERQLVVSAYMIGFGIGQLAFGPITDRFGRRAPLFFGIALYVVCALAAIFSPNFAVLLALRFAQGLGAASTRVIGTSIVRDRYSGREMAEIMSLTYMVFMVIPIIAPSIGEVILLTGPWQYIFLSMAVLAAVMFTWAWSRLPETLHPEYRRKLEPRVIIDGFRLVFTNRVAISYGLASMFLYGTVFGFIVSSQQIFVDIYGLGSLFPIAFAGMAGGMAIASFTNSRVVRRFGMRRLSHSAIMIYLVAGTTMLLLSLAGPVPFWLFYGLLVIIQFSFSFAGANMNSLSMEPLGRVAGTAAAVFGFIQTVGGALVGTLIGQSFNGTLTPIATAYLVLGLLALGCTLIAEKGKLFGVSPEHLPR